MNILVLKSKQFALIVIYYTCRFSLNLKIKRTLFQNLFVLEETVTRFEIIATNAFKKVSFMFDEKKVSFCRPVNYQNKYLKYLTYLSATAFSILTIY